MDIRTGRPHQIRIHMAAAGHPLVGEPLYDIGGVPLPSGPGRPALPGDMGYHLHARKLLLWGPQTGKCIGLFSQPPQILMTTEEKTKE